MCDVDLSPVCKGVTRRPDRRDCGIVEDRVETGCQLTMLIDDRKGRTEMSILRRWTGGDNGRSRESREETGEMMRPMMDLQQRINRVFDDFFEGGPMEQTRSMFGRTQMPRMDVSENSEAFRITADVPGMTDDDIDIRMSDNALMIRGERTHEEDEEDEDYVRRERSYGMFQRRVPLPDGIEREEISATFDNGVLNIDIPKSEEARSNWRKIEVESSS